MQSLQQTGVCAQEKDAATSFLLSKQNTHSPNTGAVPTTSTTCSSETGGFACTIIQKQRKRCTGSSAAKHAAHIFLKQANSERAITGGGGDESKSVLVRAIMHQLDQLTYTERLRMIWQFLKSYIRSR
jgi:hypothetical protein